MRLTPERVGQRQAIWEFPARGGRLVRRELDRLERGQRPPLPRWAACEDGLGPALRRSEVLEVELRAFVPQAATLAQAEL